MGFRKIFGLYNIFSGLKKINIMGLGLGFYYLFGLEINNIGLGL
jgi:hypothetical protein